MATTAERAEAAETANLVAHQVLRSAIVFAQEHVGCGDHSCLFEKPTGQGTNGHCRCLDRVGTARALARLYKAALLVCPR